MDTTCAGPGSAMLLNLGCGERFHPAWTNLDLNPSHPSIARWDVLAPLPFPDGTFDAVYHSHLLEHLPRIRALPFLVECHRVLRPGGTLRLAVPDLEAIARLYLTALESAAHGNTVAIEEHRWLVMELFDQTTRETAGGDLLEFLKREPCELARQRMGGEIHAPANTNEPNAFWRRRLHGWIFGSWRERLIRWLLGSEYPLLQIGRFRRSGEVHLWMYDQVSLQTLLVEAGFVNFRCVGPAQSAIPGWDTYQLDTTASGAVRKPDSLYVEAQRSGGCSGVRRI